MTIGNENLGDYVGETHPTLTFLRTVATGSANVAPGRPLIAGRFMFVPCSNGSHVEAFDLIDRDSPAYISSVSTAVNAAPNWIEMHGKSLFVLNTNTGTLQSVDVSNPASMTTTQTLTLTSGVSNGQRAARSGRYMLIGGPESGGNANKLTLVDIANPAAMSEVGTLTVGTVHRHIRALDATHFAVVSRDTSVLYIIDISTPASPSVAGSVTLAGTLTPCAVDPDFSTTRPYVYACGYGTGVFYVIDCVDMANPRVAGTVTTSQINVEDIVISGRYAYCCTRNAHSVEVIDIANPAKPEQTASFIVPGVVRIDRLGYSNGRIYLPDGNSSLIAVVKVGGGKAS